MGLMDKFKNLFTDEEIIEEEINDPIEIKEIKKEEDVHKLPTFMRQKLDDEEKSEEDVKFNLDDDLNLDSISLTREEKKSSNNNVIEEKSSFKFPLEFSDDDFIETRSRHREHNKKLEEEIKGESSSRELRKNSEVIKTPRKENLKKETTKVSELYKEKKQDEKKFKATPIISPIYGVLNKNYNSDEVACVKGENLEHKRHSKSVDFDSVRKKAYGNLTKEIKENLMCENCEYLKEAKECKRLKEKEVEDNIVYEVLNDTSDEYDYYSNITLDEATENYYDHGVEYEKTRTKVEKKYDDVDIKINNHENELDMKHCKKSPPPVKSSINLLSTLNKSTNEEEKKLELTDDLFNLIDSMYDERND